MAARRDRPHLIRMDERGGVRIGQRVRDVDGNELGRVRELYDWAFSVVKGPPLLFRDDSVVKYDEVRGVEDGELVVARSPRAIFQLAAGQIPDAWRTTTPAGYEVAATPAEARELAAELAAEAAAVERGTGFGPAGLTREEERRAFERRGEPS